MAAFPPAAAASVGLETLHGQVQRRISDALDRFGWYPPVALRHHAVTRLIGRERACREAELRADLAAILTAPPKVIQNMVFHQAVTVAAQPPSTPHAIAFEALGVANSMLPQPSPAELVRQFAARGITITAQSGNLHAQPGDRLTEVDRALLRAQKPAILAALARPVVVL